MLAVTVSILAAVGRAEAACDPVSPVSRTITAKGGLRAAF
jgi:hypothetical protein